MGASDAAGVCTRMRLKLINQEGGNRFEMKTRFDFFVVTFLLALGIVPIRCDAPNY